LWIAQELWEALIRYKDRQSEPIVIPVVPPPLSELVEKFGYTENWGCVLQGIRLYNECHSDAAMIILLDIAKMASHLKIVPEKLLEALRVLEANHKGLLFVDHKRQLFLVDLRAR
jgi:hypothetical protein